MMERYGWTQPCCTDCWNRENPGRPVHALVEGVREWEECVYCGGATDSGIYVRIDPETAPHPTLVKS